MSHKCLMDVDPPSGTCTCIENGRVPHPGREEILCLITNLGVTETAILPFILCLAAAATHLALHRCSPRIWYEIKVQGGYIPFKCESPPFYIMCLGLKFSSIVVSA